MRADQMIPVALDAFSRRDLDRGGLAGRARRADRPRHPPVRRSGAGSRLGPYRSEWGLRMMIVSRCLERIGDHAVDIGEQIAYLVTGEFQEFTDASHMGRKAPALR